MTDGEDDLTGKFNALLSLFVDVLAPDQIWELELHVNNDEHDVAFEIMCSRLHGAETAISDQAFAQLASVGRALQTEDTLWRDLPRRIPD